MKKGASIRWSTEQLDAFNAKSRKPRTPAAGATAATVLERFQAIGRKPQDELNDTEQEYATMLDQQKAAGGVLWWKAHAFNVRLANNTFYRIDFLVLKSDMRLEIHETKGDYITDKGMMKIKLCAEALPAIPVILCQKRAKKNGGGWTFKEFS
jgi:hypothetical protein